MNKKVLILNNIRSAINVGAIFRTADAVGIDKIYLVGYTPAPIDRFGRARNDIRKAALGAENSVEWESFENIFELIKKLKTEGFEIVALEQDEKSIDYKKVDTEKDVAVILGNETEGIAKEVLEICDVVTEIPMRGKKESLNVSVSAGVLLFRLFDHHTKGL